jgi:hypothetical protein
LSNDKSREEVLIFVIEGIQCRYIIPAVQEPLVIEMMESYCRDSLEEFYNKYKNKIHLLKSEARTFFGDTCKELIEKENRK